MLAALVVGPTAARADGSPPPKAENSWDLGRTGAGLLKPRSSSTAKAAGWQWVCHGTFARPDLSSVGGFSWGAVQQCTSELHQSIGIRVWKCHQSGDDEVCDALKGLRGGPDKEVYLYRVDATVTTCSRSKSALYRMEAYRIMADFEYYPHPVWSSFTTVACG